MLGTKWNTYSSCFLAVHSASIQWYSHRSLTQILTDRTEPLRIHPTESVLEPKPTANRLGDANSMTCTKNFPSPPGPSAFFQECCSVGWCFHLHRGDASEAKTSQRVVAAKFRNAKMQKQSDKGKSQKCMQHIWCLVSYGPIFFNPFGGFLSFRLELESQLTLDRRTLCDLQHHPEVLQPFNRQRGCYTIGVWTHPCPSHEDGQSLSFQHICNPCLITSKTGTVRRLLRVPHSEKRCEKFFDKPLRLLLVWSKFLIISRRVSSHSHAEGSGKYISWSYSHIFSTPGHWMQTRSDKSKAINAFLRICTNNIYKWLQTNKHISCNLTITLYVYLD